MPHLHLSVQAGADLILKRMKRRHLPRRYPGRHRPRPRPAAGHRHRRRPDRRLPHRNRRAVRRHARPGARGGHPVPARLPLQRAPRHPGRAHARRCRRRCAASAPPACAKPAAPMPPVSSPPRSAASPRCWPRPAKAAIPNISHPSGCPPPPAPCCAPASRRPTTTDCSRSPPDGTRILLAAQGRAVAQHPEAHREHRLGAHQAQARRGGAGRPRRRAGRRRSRHRCRHPHHRVVPPHPLRPRGDRRGNPRRPGRGNRRHPAARSPCRW